MEARVPLSHPLYMPDRAICRALRRVEPTLSVDWYAGRWAVFHGLPHYGDVDASAAALARETVRDFREQGELVPYHACLQAAHTLIRQEQLVCVVEEPDGGYRPLDARVVTHLRRLDWQRRNWWVRDYLQAARTQADDLTRSRRTATDAVWADCRQDITEYVDRHHTSFSATALRSLKERGHDSALLASA